MTSTVIIGSGIIGVSTAYYLSQHQPGSTIHLVDSSPELFASASGYAGGFLAKTWHLPTDLGPLSFSEHAELAAREGGGEKWGYKRVVSVDYRSRASEPEGGKEDHILFPGGSRVRAVDAVDRGIERTEVPPWLRRSPGDEFSVMDTEDGTAIVDPLKLCHFLLQKSLSSGVHLHHPAIALSITTDVRNELASVRIGSTTSSAETEIPATRLLLCAGAWTPQVFASLFPHARKPIPVSHLAGHSLVVKTPARTEREGERCHAVYTSDADWDLELYARPGGVVYLAGVNSGEIPLPELATGAKPQEKPMQLLKDFAKKYIASDEELEVVRTGLCFRPVTNRRTPILSRLNEEELGGVATRSGADGGVYVATGHGPWGISLSLGTGKVMAEMMQGRETSVDVSRLRFERF